MTNGGTSFGSVRRNSFRILKRVGVWSVAKLLCISYGAIGFVVGLLFALLSSSKNSFLPGFGATLGIATIVIAPLIYAVMGLIAGALSAVLFNIFARVTGGIEFEFDELGV